MGNKKGFLLAEETLKIILAVIALGILAYLLFSIYQANRDGQNLELARESLSFLSQEINSQAVSMDIYNPKGWWVLTGAPNSCTNIGWESCICICKKGDLNSCDDAGACLENVEELEVNSPIRINNPPITLNIDYDNKEIS